MRTSGWESGHQKNKHETNPFFFPYTLLTQRRFFAIIHSPHRFFSGFWFLIELEAWKQFQKKNPIIITVIMGCELSSQS